MFVDANIAAFFLVALNAGGFAQKNQTLPLITLMTLIYTDQS
jgi:hypothetical protein